MLTPTGRVALVNGANRGIGLAVARALSAKGYTLSLAGRDADALAAATGDLPEDRTHRAIWRAEDAESSTAWVEGAMARFGRIDALVANAGVIFPASLEEGEEDHYDEMWDVNFKGPLRLIRASMPALRSAGDGRIVVVASLAGKRMLGDNLGYTASKFAAVALTHAARRAGWDDGVRATAICPGLVDTDMVASVTAADGQFKISPETIAESAAYAMALPKEASVAELLINSRSEPMM